MQGAICCAEVLSNEGCPAHRPEIEHQQDHNCNEVGDEVCAEEAAQQVHQEGCNLDGGIDRIQLVASFPAGSAAGS